MLEAHKFLRIFCTRSGGVKRANHTTVQLLAMVANERQDHWIVQRYLTWNSPTTIRSAPPLAWPSTRLTCGQAFPLTKFDRSGFAGHQSLACDHLAYCDLASERQQRAPTILFANCML